tara:strand:+ start:232 stop:594 length:363 start_codon:yes stop_codon:yes gene_type:complete
MAAPNIVNVSGIVGKTETFSLSATVGTSLVINAAASNYVYKINSIVVANITTTTHTVTMQIDDSTNTRKIASTISVPANAALVVSDKNTSFYLEEGMTLEGGADVASKLDATVAYDTIID